MTQLFNIKTSRKVFLALTLFFSLVSKGQNFIWVDQIKGIVNDYSDFANGIAIDDNENSYIIGNTESFLFDRDPTASGTSIIDNSNINHTFRGTYLIKVDSNGNYLWGQTFGSYKGSDYAYDVKIGTDGNIYALLSLQELNSTLNIIESYIKIIKFSPNGNILSTKTIKQNYGYNNNIHVNSFDLDNQNNIYMTGYFTGNITLDTTNPSLNISASIGSYLLKINNNGNFDWVKQFDNYIGSEVVVRPDGNVNFLFKKNNDYTLYNIDKSNNSIIWQKDFINQIQKNFHVSNSGIVILGEKNYYDTIDVDPSSSILNISGYDTSFIIFLNLNGDFIDVKKFNKPINGNITLSALTTDINGDYFFGGNFKDTVDLDPSTNTFNLTSDGSYSEAFYLKLDKNRNFDSAVILGEERPKLSPYNNCYLFEIKKLKIVNKNNYLMGDFMWTCDFDPSTTTQFTLKTVNSGTINRDGFILKLGPCDSSTPNGNNNQSFCSSQNATISNLVPNSNSIKWYNSLTSQTPLTNSTSLINGQKYYAARQIGSCPESTDRLEVTVSIIQTPTKPIASNVKFCKSDNAKLSDILISGQSIKYYSELIGGPILPSTTILQDNTTYYATQTVNDCESERTSIIVTVNNVVKSTATSPQTFCIQQNATVENIGITGQNVKWYNTLTAGSLLPNTTLLQNNTIYYASQNINGCESERIPVTINIQNTPPPTGNSNQQFCTSQNSTIADIQITGDQIKWYDASSNGNLLPTTINLQNGKTYFASQTVNTCESERFEVTISIVNTPSAPIINGNTEFCKNKNATLNNIQIQGQNIKWYGSNIAAVTLSNSTILENNKTYYVSQTIGCESDRTPILVRIYDTALPTGNSNQQFCIDQISTISNLNIIGTSIKWYDAAVNGTILSETDLLENGIYYVTQTLNSCESERLAITVKIQDTQIPIADSPQTFCIQKNASINDIVITGQNIKWFENSSSTINLSESTPLENGIIYYASQTVNNCESDRIPVLINILEATTVDCINFVDDLPYPKFFTPNNDTYNDTWTIDFAYLKPNTGIRIFDRYGKFLKELYNNAAWDGTYLGRNEPASDYWFTVIRFNGTEYRGHFSLKR